MAHANAEHAELRDRNVELTEQREVRTVDRLITVQLYRPAPLQPPKEPAHPLCRGSNLFESARGARG